MALESKHINLLRSCANWLRTRGQTWYARKVSWDSMMLEYARDLDEIANELTLLNPPKTVIKLEDLFGEKDG